MLRGKWEAESRVEVELDTGDKVSEVDIELGNDNKVVDIETHVDSCELHGEEGSVFHTLEPVYEAVLSNGGRRRVCEEAKA